MNSFRKHKPAAPDKLKNRQDRGGAVATQEGSDSGSVDAELSNAAASSMQEFAAKDRARRLPAIQKRDRNAAAARKYFGDRDE